MRDCNLDRKLKACYDMSQSFMGFTDRIGARRTDPVVECALLQLIFYAADLPPARRKLMVGVRPEFTTLVGALEHSRLTRRDLVKRGILLGATVPAIGGLLVACAEDDDVVDVDDEDPAVDPVDDDDDVVDDEPVDDPDDAVDDEPDDDPVDDDDRYGGTLTTAIVGEPPQLDMMAGTQILMRFVATHMVEGLFTHNAELEVIPELADTHEVSDDGLLNTVNLRQGITFHNGEDMTADDVIASLDRWVEISGLGATWLSSVDEYEQVDDHTIDFHMNTPLGTFGFMLATRSSGGCPIYPRSIVEDAGPEPIDNIVSTGPYKLVEWVRDRHVHMERFEEYQSRTDEPDGYGGAKHRYVDEIYFVPVPDEAAMIAGLRSGEYQFLENISPDLHGDLEDDPDLVTEPEPFTWMSLIFNTAQGNMADQTMRQAVQACLNHEEIMQAGYGEFHRLDPSLILQEIVWHTTAGGELYDQRDPDRAMELLEEAGYDGEEITFLSTSEYTDRYNASLMASQQMEDCGMNVNFDVYDWATVGERRADPELWDLFYTSIGGLDPAMIVFISRDDWPGWYATPRKQELAAQLREETDFDTRYELWEELHELIYEEVPCIKLGDIYQIYARTARLQGFEPPIMLSPALWNVWLNG
jgi:peptide/nickel transport system substrate-binding protein